MTDGVDRLAWGILQRVCARFAMGAPDRTWLDQPVFRDGAGRLGPRALDSLDVVEVMVGVEEDLGVKLLDREDLAAAGSIRGLAARILGQANSVAVDRFCSRWAPEEDVLHGQPKASAASRKKAPKSPNR